MQVHGPPLFCLSRTRPAQVFMDAVNRRVATETLLHFAMAKDEFQYIFLTPQVCVGGCLEEMGGWEGCVRTLFSMHVPCPWS